MIEFLSTALGVFIGATGFLVLFRMNRRSNHLRRIAWVVTASGAIGVVACGLSDVPATDYYVMTLAGFTLLSVCGIRCASNGGAFPDGPSHNA